MMKINRNTINSDIKQLYEKMSKEFSEFNAGMWIVKQLNRLETQRARLVGDLEGQIEMHNKIIIEKLIFDIDQKIIQFSSKMMPNGESITIEKHGITDEEIRDITRHMIKDLGLEASKINKDEILFRIIKKEKCDMQKAGRIYSRMSELGLELCMNYDRGVPTANFLQFATLRDFISMDDKDEVFKVITKQAERQVIEEQKIEEFEEKYGPKTNWSDGVRDELDKAIEASDN